MGVLGNAHIRARALGDKCHPCLFGPEVVMLLHAGSAWCLLVAGTVLKHQGLYRAKAACRSLAAAARHPADAEDIEQALARPQGACQGRNHPRLLMLVLEGLLPCRAIGAWALIRITMSFVAAWRRGGDGVPEHEQAHGEAHNVTPELDLVLSDRSKVALPVAWGPCRGGDGSPGHERVHGETHRVTPHRRAARLRRLRRGRPAHRGRPVRTLAA